MGIFSRKPVDLSIPQNRTLNFNQARKRLEWMDKVNIWEGEYASMHFNHGWRTIQGKDFSYENRLGTVHWQVGEVIVVATFDEDTGIVTERIKQKKQ